MVEIEAIDEPYKSSERETERDLTEATLEKVQDTSSEHLAVVLVAATAVIENSPTDNLSQDAATECPSTERPGNTVPRIECPGD
jgi:hypothetical protein